ncbi:MAG: hypothetical protein K6T83_00075 [Alicyclobacillus sp.]|nr:hypothetical protein [Alicyclobacillus sp.]
MKIVIKAQRSIPDGNRILIYNCDRSIYQEMDGDGVLSAVMGDRFKCYFEVTINDDGLMSIDREVKASW